MVSRKALFALLSVLLTSFTLQAQQDSGGRQAPAPPRRLKGNAMPPRVPPEFVTIVKIDADKGVLDLRKTVLVAQMRTVTVPVQIEGRTVEQQQQVLEQIPVEQRMNMELDRSRFINGRGEKVAHKKALGKLEKGQVILLCWDVNGVEESVLKVLSPDALILLPKNAGVPGPAPKKEEPRREDRSDR